MMVLIATIIFFVSIIGMGIILFRKIPILTELSLQETEPGKLKKFRKKIKNSRTLKFFSAELLLQKALSRIKVLTSRTESKTSAWLANSHQRALKKKDKFSNDYWRKIKRGK